MNTVRSSYVRSFRRRPISPWVIGLALLTGLPALAKSPSKTKATVVKIEGMQFVPKDVSVSAGQEIEWINDDLVPHTVTAAQGGFDSQTIPPGGRWTYAPKKKGHLEYKCSFHPTMSGSIEVK
jgi:plastocyanin